MQTIAPDIPPRADTIPGIEGGVLRVGGRVYVTEERLAAALDVTTRTVRRWDAQRLTPPKIKLGRTVLFDYTDPAAWLEMHRQHGGAAAQKRGGGGRR